MQQAALSRRERQFDMVMRLLRFGRFLVVRLRKSAKSAGDIGVSCIYIEYACMVILSQIAQRSQMNAAGCIISQRKTVSGSCGYWVLSA